AWLKRIVINRSLDALGKRKAIFEDIESYVGIIDESPEETSINEEIESKAEKIKTAIKELPDGYRIILSLYILEGYDHDEISEILNISSSTSRSQLSRAKSRLLKDLQYNGKYRE
ncbi:MAG TPA: sigma-70 family RNA polymerase sigma factor, partial [Bacteroidales bacterium]|nr:sigma-70 family RNA polymerase sigma factor [Bacteroidales bacterium]